MDEYVGVYVTHHQMQVVTGGDPADLPIYTVGDELLHVGGENVLTVFTGVHGADVDVRVRTGVEAPTPEPGWTVASEATLWASGPSLSVWGLFGSSPDGLRDIPIPGPGLVRVQVRGRDLSATDSPPEGHPREKYEVHVRPVPADTGLRTLRPDDGRPGWDPAPDRAAAWAVARMVARADLDPLVRHMRRGAPDPPVPRADVRRVGTGPADLTPVDLLGAAVDGPDLLVPVGDLRIRLHPLPAGPAVLRYRWTWERAPEPIFAEPTAELPDDVPGEIELRLGAGAVAVHHRGVRAPDAVLLGLVWDHLLDRAARLGDDDVPAPHPWQAEFAERAAAARREAEGSRRQSAEFEALRWGGRLPSERGRPLPANSGKLARLDRPLLDALERSTPAQQRAVAVWAADRGALTAGLSGVDWIAPALAALRAGDPLPPPFDVDDQAPSWDRLLGDPQVPQTVVAVPGGPPNALQQAMAFPAIRAAAHPDPLAAAVEAVHAAAIAHGDDHRRFLADLRAAFPALA